MNHVENGVVFSLLFPLYAYRIKDQGLEPSNLKIQDLNVSFCQSVVRVLTRFNPYFGPLSDYDRVKESQGKNMLRLGRNRSKAMHSVQIIICIEGGPVYNWKL